MPSADGQVHRVGLALEAQAPGRPDFDGLGRLGGIILGADDGLPQRGLGLLRVQHPECVGAEVQRLEPLLLELVREERHDPGSQPLAAVGGGLEIGLENRFDARANPLLGDQLVGRGVTGRRGRWVRSLSASCRPGDEQGQGQPKQSDASHADLVFGF